MRILAYSPGPPSRSDALMRQLTDWLTLRGHSIGWRYFGAYNEYEPCDVGITIGWNTKIHEIHQDLLNDGKWTFAFSDGFVKRGWGPGSFFACSRNGLHAYGDIARNMPGDRWRKLGGSMLPWRSPRGNDPVIVAHQHVDAFDGTDRQPFFVETISRLKQLTKREIVVRLHPRDRKRQFFPRGVSISTHPLGDDLQRAFAVVTYDSNIAVDATLFGVPVFTRGRTMADPIACKDLNQIDDPPYPDRQQWAHDLAFAQWSVDELRAGLPWIHLIGGLQQGKPSGLVDAVDTPAKEPSYTDADHEDAKRVHNLIQTLCDWNVQQGQTINDVVREIKNPKHADKIAARRAHFDGMKDGALRDWLQAEGIKANGADRETLIARAIHASL